MGPANLRRGDLGHARAWARARSSVYREPADHDVSVCIQSAQGCTDCEVCKIINPAFIDALREWLGLRPLQHSTRHPVLR